jgi:5-methylcytosine-specific restriction endonuclease McrA
MARIRRSKTREARPERVKRSRWHTVDKSLMKFYNSKAWRQTRENKLAHNPFCEQCEANGIITEGYYIDHIEPVLERPDLRLSFNNLQTLCIKCNASKTSKQANKKK